MNYLKSVYDILKHFKKPSPLSYKSLREDGFYVFKEEIYLCFKIRNLPRKDGCDNSFHHIDHCGNRRKIHLLSNITG